MAGIADGRDAQAAASRGADPEAVLFASYGTTIPSERDASIDPVAHELALAFPEARITQAYASGKVLRALAGTAGEMPGVPEALEGLAASGVRNAVVQPGHLVHGVTFEVLARQVEAARGSFDRLVLGEPLLSSEADLSAVARALCSAFPQVSGSATVLVGHGFARDEAAGRDPGEDNAFALVGERLLAQGRRDVLVGVMNAEKGGAADRTCGFDRIVRELNALDWTAGASRRVTVAPLMLTAGRHARTQIAGTGPESWTSRLAAHGFEVETRLVGLGSIAGVRALYAAHARSAWSASTAPASC